MSRKYRGVFQDRGCWWIEYWGSDDRRHREKAGSLTSAKKLVELRRTERLEGRKLPKLRTRAVLFRELTDAALKYSEPGEKGTNHSRMKVLVSEFGNSPGRRDHAKRNQSVARRA